MDRTNRLDELDPSSWAVNWRELVTQLHANDVVLPFFAEREPVEDQPRA